MKNGLSKVLLFACVVLLFQGCTPSAWYDGLREMERQNCYKIENRTEQRECLDKLDKTSYGQYKKDREETKKQ